MKYLHGGLVAKELVCLVIFFCCENEMTAFSPSTILWSTDAERIGDRAVCRVCKILCVLMLREITEAFLKGTCRLLCIDFITNFCNASH